MALTDKAYYYMKSAHYLHDFGLINDEEFEYLLDQLDSIIESLDTSVNFFFL